MVRPCSANEATEAIDTALRRLESRWCAVAARAVASREKVLTSSVVSQFFVEFETVKNLVAVYDTWANGEGYNIADDFMMLSRQLEQCRVRLPVDGYSCQLFNTKLFSWL
jgi:hypothetical protein